MGANSSLQAELGPLTPCKPKETQQAAFQDVSKLRIRKQQREIQRKRMLNVMDLYHSESTVATDSDHEYDHGEFEWSTNGSTSSDERTHVLEDLFAADDASYVDEQEIEEMLISLSVDEQENEDPKRLNHLQTSRNTLHSV